MKVTRDVILDLLPVYLANEASADTRALVEQFLADDPALARLVNQSKVELGEAAIPSASLKDLEMKSFVKTKRLLHWQKLVLGLAIFTTCLLGAFQFTPKGDLAWLWINTPGVAWLLLAMAVFFWTAYFNLNLKQNK